MQESNENNQDTDIEFVKKSNNGIRHNDDTKAEVLMMHARGWSYSRIAEKKGISTQTAHRWCNDIYRDAGNDAFIVAEIKKNRVNKKIILANRLMTELDDPSSDRFKNAKLFEIASTIKMLEDSTRLDEGKSTQNIAVIVKRHEDSKKEKEDLESEIALSDAKIAALRGASIPPPLPPE